MTNRPTQDRLLEIAIEQFGRLGAEGASTREIARLADTPMSSITYHFGGKEGLYLAAARHIADTIGSHLVPLLADTDGQVPDDPALARTQLRRLILGMLDTVLREERASHSRFVMREQADPTAAFEILYGGVMGPLMQRVAALLVVIARGTLSLEDARIRAMSLAGQGLFFRVAHAASLRTANWQVLGDRERAQIGAAVADNLDAIFDRLEARGREGAPS